METIAVISRDAVRDMHIFFDRESMTESGMELIHHDYGDFTVQVKNEKGRLKRFILIDNMGFASSVIRSYEHRYTNIVDLSGGDNQEIYELLLEHMSTRYKIKIRRKVLCQAT